MQNRQTAIFPRRLFDRFRPGAPGMPGLLPQLQAYGGLQASAARAQRPLQTLLYQANYVRTHAHFRPRRQDQDT